jgi:hypothetical protein
VCERESKEENLVRLCWKREKRKRRKLWMIVLGQRESKEKYFG